FEEVKAELATEMKKQQAQSKVEAAAEQARNELMKSPGNAAAIAAKYNLAHYNVNEASSRAPIPEIGVVDEFDSAVFTAEKGKITNLVVAQGNRMAFAIVNNIVPARPAELAEVEGQVRSALSAQKGQELLTKKQKEVEDLVKQGADLKKIAQAVGVEVKASNDFTRDGAAEGIGTGTHFTELFTKEPGAMIGPLQISDQIIVAKLLTKTPADMAKFAEEKEQILSNLKGRRAQERKDLFEDGIVAKLIDRGKVKINQDAIKRMLDSYRS
ncbi:MAG: hypothetical protein FJW32_29320, partial [Acidobacteria bacterium]|nr:hypothetical protein [Acidobacteriota bacterium]